MEEKVPTNGYIAIAQSQFPSWENTFYGIKTAYDLGPMCTIVYQKHTSGDYGAILLFGYEFDRMIYATLNNGKWSEPRYVANKSIAI